MTWFVGDPELSPPDIAISPKDKMVAGSEYPFGVWAAVGTIR